MPDERPAAVEELLENARRNLDDAQRLLEWGSTDSAVSRAYYAMCNAAQAPFSPGGITRSRHTGVYAAFGYYFVRTGQVPPTLHAAMEAAYRRRLIADYAPESVSQEEAQEVVRDAEAFLRANKELLAGEGI